MTGKHSSLRLAAFLVAFWAILAGVTLAKGGFYLAKHEGDTLHLLQMVFRMADGEWPHLDFMTPIGILAFAPIVAFVKLGTGIGTAIVMAQVLVALILLPALYRAASSRFDGWLGYLFGAAVLVLALALVHGEAQRSVSISMHYNRWAWAASYLAIVLAVLPSRTTRRDGLDGTIIGLCAAFLLLCKVTYFAAFAIPVLAALLLRRAWRSLTFALLAMSVIALVLTVLAGPAFWSAYLGDLLTVARSEVRPQPGAGLRTVVGAPAWLGGSLLLFLGVVLLRQAGEEVLGVVLLLLAPAFIYVTYQNFGNDPQWLMLLAILLLAARPADGLRNPLGWDMARALQLAAVAAIALGTPSFLNLAYSPFRHLGLKADEYTPMLAAMPDHRDLFTREVRANRVDGLIALDVEGSGLEDRAARAEREKTRTEWRGETLRDCELQMGLIAWFETIAADLDDLGLTAGKPVFVADLFSSLWLFGDVIRLKDGAPWYYGGLPGFAHAEFMLVPDCPAALAVRKEILKAVDNTGVGVTEIARRPLYTLYALDRG